jgi:hypothetical protein
MVLFHYIHGITPWFYLAVCSRTPLGIMSEYLRNYFNSKFRRASGLVQHWIRLWLWHNLSFFVKASIKGQSLYRHLAEWYGRGWFSKVHSTVSMIREFDVMGESVYRLWLSKVYDSTTKSKASVKKAVQRQIKAIKDLKLEMANHLKRLECETSIEEMYYKIKQTFLKEPQAFTLDSPGINDSIKKRSQANDTKKKRLLPQDKSMMNPLAKDKEKATPEQIQASINLMNSAVLAPKAIH